MNLKIIKIVQIIFLLAIFNNAKCEKNPCLPGWVIVNGQCRKSCESSRDCNIGEVCTTTPEGRICN